LVWKILGIVEIWAKTRLWWYSWDHRHKWRGY